jgi:outer membrane protein OmpA-like peptidoglycan-associated protein
MGRGGYIPTGYRFDPVVLDAKLPLEFLEARNAVRIAKSEGAEAYAGDSYQHAVQLMNTTDAYATGGHTDRKQLIAESRETVQTAEDAREIAVKRIEDNRRTSELQASADAQAQLQARADEANQQKLQAQADATRAQDDTANAEAARLKAQNDTANAEAARLKAQNDMANQAASTEAINTAQADADRYRMIAQHAQEGEQKADSDKIAMRAQLEARLNEILQTRDSARGLIVSMSDVLFDTGKYSLKSGAREKLAKVAGILIAYPSLNIAVGGYTDNVGGDEMNQKLSENRAGTVRDYLVQGVVANSVSATGFGNSSPVASNDNSGGRQENRRVELVVSGEAIGTPVNATTGSLR